MPVRRNLHSLIKGRVPAGTYALLRRAGRLADRTGVSLYVVGGFVRDLLLGYPNPDIDLVVEGDGIGFAREFARRNGARVIIHERFGTAVIVFPHNFKLDVSTARTEYYEHPAALPTVERGSIENDLYRRDFTVNTLAIRLNPDRFGQLLDCYEGQRDLRERAIRVLHSRSFIDDPTRAFRAVRFEHRLGFRMDKETQSLLTDAVKEEVFCHLSGSRLLEEVTLLLSEEKPRRALVRLNELALLRVIHPGLAYTSRLNRLLKSVEEVLEWYKVASREWPDSGRQIEPWIIYFMTLMEGLPADSTEEATKRLRVPGRVARNIQAGHGAARRLSHRSTGRPAPKPAEVCRAFDGLSDEALVLLMASSQSGMVRRGVSKYLATYRHIKPTVTGKDLRAMGLSPGPLFKKILDQIREARLNGEVSSVTEERALAMHMAERLGRNRRR